MNRLTPAKRIQVIAALVEGNSIRATVRMTGIAKNTIVKHRKARSIRIRGRMDVDGPLREYKADLYVRGPETASHFH